MTTKAVPYTTAQRELADIKGPCPVCGALMYDTDVDSRASLAIIEESAAAKYAAEHLEFVCRKCCALRDHERVRRQAARKVDRMIEETFAQGLYLRESAIRDTFAQSDPAIERLSPEVWCAARRWKVGDHTLWVRGPQGTGKTFLAHCILSSMLTQGVSIAEMTGSEINKIGNDWHPNDGVKTFRPVALLLIDDIDSPAWTHRGIDVLRDMLDFRYRRGLSTLVTANNSGQVLRDRLKQVHPNPAVPGTALDRLQPVDVLELAGQSHRGVAQKEIA